MTDRIEQTKAISGDSRREILRLLHAPAETFSHQESADPVEFGVCMNLIAEALGVSQPTVSRHVEILRLAGFVRVKKYQQWSYCSRDENGLSEFHQWLRDDLSIM